MNFKVGDRVAADWFSPRAEIFIRIRGVLAELSDNGARVEITGSEGSRFICSPRSIRRLKKKEPVTYWVNEYVDGGFGDGVHKSKDSADLFCTRKVRAALLELRLVKRHKI